MDEQPEEQSEEQREQQIEECLVYFRQAIARPESVPPWSDWWQENEPLVERVFPLMEYVRLKHRKLLGARQILQRFDELPKDYTPPSPRLTGSCGHCGERVPTSTIGTESEPITCPHCGTVFADSEEPGGSSPG